MIIETLQAASHPKTRDTVMRLIGDIAIEGTDVLELGAGSGLMSLRVANFFNSKGFVNWTLLAVDVSQDSFKAPGISFERWDLNEAFPCTAERFDVVFSVEVLEHLQNPYKFIEECERVLKPGGLIILTTPNNLHIGSRLRYLRTGFFKLYEPPSTKLENAGRLSGHIMPIHAAYVDYGLRRVGFRDTRWHSDKLHKSSLLLYYMLYPFWKLFRWINLKHVEDYDPQVFRENRIVLEVMESRLLLTSRSLIMSSTKPKT